MMRIAAAETRPEPYTETYELRDLGDGMTSIIDATGKPMAGKNKGTAPNDAVVPIPNAFFPKTSA